MKSEGNFEQIQDYLNKISVSGNHLLAIVNDVLEVSRIESGQTKLEELPCNIKNIVDEVEVILQGQAQEKTQTFIVDTSKVKDYYIYCDRLRVKEVLVNLLGNAVKFTPKGGKIELRIIQNEPAPEGYANYEVHVKDNGCGMSPEFMGKMFLPFERERTSTVSGIQGTGLGLSIVKQFVVLMDIQMPVMDGYMATKKIRSLEDSDLANIPIIALSANAFEEDRKASTDAGMNGHLPKPVNVSELLKMLCKLF